MNRTKHEEVNRAHRPAEIVCAVCQAIVTVGSFGRVPETCTKGCPCETCGERLSVTATHYVKTLGRQRMCGTCRAAAETPEQRAERMGRLRASRRPRLLPLREKELHYRFDDSTSARLERLARKYGLSRQAVLSMLVAQADEME